MNSIRYENEIIKRRSRVRRALIAKGLDEVQSMVGALAWEGWSHAKIADLLKISEKHVGKILRGVYDALCIAQGRSWRKRYLMQMFRDSAFHNDRE